ncbi:DNA mismatch repair protein MutL (plasmid) [Legionella adelaidensis]|uniref:DNA mismatch repair protein MutL n=1 Tax=Legionella adelaidensis TaxID=45056 RepID=A0A0W0R0B6_9GAMM|nr:DNA mismatch repair endonuclease MutL [Legionella adelaidensis]KTC64518.1 DNA mismatch repair protein MutL [Legionella adelaidensis]VEH85886.1 DNA mismatch repair protein MutL [Legionella adelaidensis]
MVNRIQQLSKTVANQIAAGEVIERPASVVKELLENALDAAATIIHIEIQGGGLHLIRISDNGHGIIADDLPLAVSAHATSKICTLNDLYTITTMGFRGEALASISSVSRLKILSKPEMQEHAMLLTTENNHYEIIPAARAKGTTVEVRDLFFNIPVRKRFLKSEQIEFQAIETIVKRFALSSPQIAISLKHNDKEIFNLSSGHSLTAEQNRIKKILGKSFFEQAGFLEVERAGIHLRGWMSGESYQRSQNDKQWVYINQRMVKDKLIQHAIKRAYEGVLYPGKHPSCLLFITISPTEVDVNVHPTKHEVRFQDPRLVHDFISSQLIAALHSQKPYLEIPKELNNFVKEQYNPPLPERQNTSFRQHEFIYLNANFFLLLRPNKPSLFIQFKSFFQAYTFHQLLNTEKPFKQRTLLLPIRFKLSTIISDVYLLQLNEVGIDVQLISERELAVRAIPVLLPYLKIHDFLLEFFKRKLDGKDDILILLSQCQEVALDEIVNNDLIREYIVNNYENSGWAVELTSENCQALFHMAQKENV